MPSYLLYRLGQFIAVNIPLKIAYRLAIVISDLHYIFAFKDKRAVTENLKAIFPEKPMREIRRIRIWMFRNFAKYLVDFFRYEKIDRDYIASNVKIEDIKNLDEALVKGRGAIILTAHLGNWELGGLVLAVRGYSLWGVALPHKNKLVNDFFDTQRRIKNVKVIPLGRAVRECRKILKDRCVLALVGDRDFPEKGIILDFFGKPTRFPEGPAAFALKPGAPILPTFMLRNPDDSFVLKIERPMELASSGDMAKDRINIILQYKTIFEEYIRKYPDQWHIFRKFWVENETGN